jgi:hypothetical protein
MKRINLILIVVAFFVGTGCWDSVSTARAQQSGAAKSSSPDGDSNVQTPSYEHPPQPYPKLEERAARYFSRRQDVKPTEDESPRWTRLLLGALDDVQYYIFRYIFIISVLLISSFLGIMRTLANGVVEISKQLKENRDYLSKSSVAKEKS